MSIKQFYGLNIAVSNLEEAKKNFKALFGGVEPTYLGENEFAMPHLEGYRFDVGGLKIHVIASKTEDTGIANFVKKKGEGVFLISLQSDDLESDIEQIKKETPAKFVMEPNGEMDWCKVNFIHPKSMHGVQVEVIQVK
jgi:methylmalonyl-CoA epimerase